MKYSPLSLEAGWQPKKIVGNTAYYYNPDTGQTKSEFVPNSDLSQRKKEFADWFKTHRKFKAKNAYGKPVLIRRKDYTTLSRDPLAPFDFSNISKRQGIVTQVLSANRLVIDNSYVVTVPGIKIPSKRTDPIAWEEARKFAQSMVLGRQVYLGVNMNNPYAENGDILASVDFNIPPQELKEIQADEGWGIFDYINVAGYAIGSGVRNVAILGQTGKLGTTTIGDRYSLSDTFTFTRLYHQVIGDAKPLSLYGKGETEGEWYEKLATDIVGDPSNYVSIGERGISLFGIRLLRGQRYMKRLTTLKASTIKWANTFEGHVRVAGLGSTIDIINRNWRRVNMLLEPAYYVTNTMLDIAQSVWYGEMNPLRYFDDIAPTMKQARNPIFRNEVAFKVAGHPRGGYTARELEAFYKEYDVVGTSSGRADVLKYGKQGLVDRFWSPMVDVATRLSDVSRRAMFRDGLRKGLSPPAAAKRMNEFLFDYNPAHLTAFERAYVNRVFPYYIPQTRNIAMIVKSSLAKPYKTTAIAKWQIQQRQFAGNDKFKDYDRNTIIQKVGDGKYIRVRFPTEDIFNLPEKFASGRKALLSTTYPIFNMFPELYEDKNYFDDTTPSGNYPKYLMKKFISREYYAYRDATNPNMPMSEFLSKHVLGLRTITPSDRQSYQQALIDAGFSPSQALQEADATARRQQYFKANALRVAAKAHAQSILPPNQQDRPQVDIDAMASIEPMGWIEGGFWEKFQFIGQYWWTAGISNVATYVQTGKMGNKGVLDRIPPSSLIKSFERRYLGKEGMLAENFPIGGVFALGLNKEQRRQGFYLAADIVLDLLWFVNWRTKIGRVIFTPEGEKVLSSEGRAVFAKLNPVVVSGRAEGLYGKAAARRMVAEADAKFMKYVADNPGFAERVIGSRFMQSAGLQVFGRTIINASKFRTAFNIIKLPVTIPLKGVSTVAKEVSEVMAPIGKAIKDKMLPAQKIQIKWQDDIQKSYDALQNNIRQLQRTSHMQVEENMNDALRKTGVWQDAKEMAKKDPTHGFFWHFSKLSEETANRLSNFIELGKKDMSAQGVIDDFVMDMERMADEEIPRGILKTTRLNYAEHLATAKYKALKGYTEPVLGKLNIRAPFAKRRWNEGTIAEQNAETFAKHHIQKFEANIWKIWKIRKDQHIEVVETFDYLRRIAAQHGVKNDFFNRMYLRNSYGVSKIPVLQDVLLPTELITQLEKLPRFRAHIATLTPRPNLLKRMWDLDGWIAYQYKRNVTMFNPKFVPRNLISSLHQNVMKGFYDVTKYLPQKWNNGIAFKTKEGRNIYAWELNQWYMDYKVLKQPGMAEWKVPDYENALDKAGDAPRYLTIEIENLVRTRLFNKMIYEGYHEADAGKIVDQAHLDYTKKYGRAMEIAARFIVFPTWSFGAPEMIARNMIERPWQFALTSKVIDAWNSPADKIMLRYKPEYLKDKIMLKIPFTDDAFYSPPLSTTELSNFALIFHKKEFQFYWEEAKNNPNTLLRFAKYELDVEWLKRGGGSPKVVGDAIVITYRTTGETITAYVDGEKLKFIDGNSGTVIKEYETIGTGNKTGIVTQGEPINEMIRKYGYAYKTLPFFALVGATKFLPQSTGNPSLDATRLIASLTGFAPLLRSIEDANDPDTPAYAKILDYFGDVTFAHTWLGNEPLPSKPKLKRALMRAHGNYKGCGW